MTDENEKKPENNISTFNFEDFIQIIVGSSVLAVPVAFSEEAWRLSETLPLSNTALLFVLSLLFISLYTFQGIFSGDINHRYPIVISRIILDYFITFFVVIIILFALNKLPLDTIIVAIKRVIIISFPASMAAVIVDGFDKE